VSDNITLPREVAEHLTKMLEECPLLPNGDWSERDCAALTALRAHLAAPRLEPVLWLRKDGCRFLGGIEPSDGSELPLYAAPPPAAPSEDIETLRRENERLQNLLYDQMGKVFALRAAEQMRKQIAELKHAENERLKAERDEAVKAEREACCKIVYGLCESDNSAQRTVEAIRARGQENKS
jgi:hypothetical protein